jgi:hypothetical protein
MPLLALAAVALVALLALLARMARRNFFSPNRRAVRLLDADPERARALLLQEAVEVDARREQPNVALQNLAVAHLRLGDLEAARLTLERCLAQPRLTGVARQVVMSSCALTRALLGDLDAAERCLAEGYPGDRAARWVLDARRGAMPTPPAAGSVPSAWARSLFEVVDAFARREVGYRGTWTRLSLGPGLRRAVTAAHRPRTSIHTCRAFRPNSTGKGPGTGFAARVRMSDRGRMGTLATFAAVVALGASALACARELHTTFPEGPVNVVPVADGSTVTVSEPNWFSVPFPAAPSVGERVLSTAYGPMRLKRLKATAANLYVEVDYCRFGVVIDDVDGLLRDVHDSLVHSGGTRVVADDRLVRGGWDGISTRMLVAPRSELNASDFAFDFRVLLLVRADRIVMLEAGTQQGDEASTARALVVADSLRLSD